MYDEFDKLKDDMYDAKWNRYQGDIRKVAHKCMEIMECHSVYEPWVSVQPVPETRWCSIVCTGMIENICICEHFLVYNTGEKI